MEASDCGERGDAYRDPRVCWVGVSANGTEFYGDVVRSRHGETRDVSLCELSSLLSVRLSYDAFLLSPKDAVRL